MKKKYLTNLIIPPILIISTILMPLSFIPKKAEAQSLTGYATGLAPAIAILPQCKNVINSGVKSLFSGIGNLLNSSSENFSGETITDFGEISSISDLNGREIKMLDDTAGSLTSESDSIKVNIEGTATAKKIDTINANTQATKTATESMNANSTCIQSIGRLIIKMLLQKLTVSTVNWINSGFDGSPAFIQDSSKFFGDIAKNEVLQFGLEISDPQLFPFGKVWMQNTAIAFNNKFQDNARYSLNELIQKTNPEYSAITFQEDFSQGGWNAWTAMTQVPANNPLGFKLMADNELQQRLEGTTQSTAEAVHEALAQANGFLGDQRCADPVGLTREEHNKALIAGEKDSEGNIIGICKRWEYVTPGKLISEAATTAINYQNNAYLNATDLNDAVAAITDALLGQFSSTIMEKGFAGLSNQGADGTLYTTSNVSTGVIFQTQTEKDFEPSQLTSSWLAANPDFNIRTDLTQALIDEQRTYSDKLALQNKELNSTTDGKPYKIDVVTGRSNAYGLIPAIYQLDYCIPGPHPGWEQDAQETLTNIVIPGANSAPGNSTFVNIVSSIPVIGGILGSIFGQSDDPGELSYEARKQYSYLFYLLTGYGLRVRDDGGSNAHNNTSMDPQDNNISTQAGLAQILNKILSRYIEIMNKTYFSSPEILPAVSKEAAASFNQLTGYSQMIKNNEDKIISLKTTVNILGQIKDAVDLLNAQYPDGGDVYENELKTQINAFGRLSLEMVNGNDIASADNLYKQIVDKKNYIYNDLLKGPYGCEAFLSNPQNITNFSSAGPGVNLVYNPDWSDFNVNSVKRMTYPHPILYDYNNFTKKINNGFQVLPDPWGSGYLNTMPDANSNLVSGRPSLYLNDDLIYDPGFLNFTFFSNATDLSKFPGEGPERLYIGDLVDTYGHETQGSKYIRLGNPYPFENTIGIY